MKFSNMCSNFKFAINGHNCWIATILSDSRRSDIAIKVLVCKDHPLFTMSCNLFRTPGEGQSAKAMVRSSEVWMSKFVRTFKHASFLIRGIFPQKYAEKGGYGFIHNG